jgi:putative ABC transport system permease protein
VLDVPGFDEPVLGQLVSVPEDGDARLNRLALRQGRLPRLGAPGEAVLSAPFAEAHSLEPGNQLRAVINGRWRELFVVGVALSPEYVYTIGPGALMPDDRRFGGVWLGHEALQAAYDLEGAFNDVALSLLRGADPEQVVDRVDRILERYGGRGAYARVDQLSNWFLSNEIAQLKTMARFLPTIFLAIAWHYVKLVLAIGGVGILLGWYAGYWLGLYNTTMCAEFHRFPFLLFRPGPEHFLIAAAVSLAAALLGAISAVRRAAALPPAAAMFRRSGLARWRFTKAMDQPTRIVLRQLSRWPLRSAVTTAGIAMSVAVLIVAMQWLDAINRIVDGYFLQAQAQDVTVGLVEPRTATAVGEVARLPGVLAVEPGRAVAAKIRHGSG